MTQIRRLKARGEAATLSRYDSGDTIVIDDQERESVKISYGMKN